MLDQIKCWFGRHRLIYRWSEDGGYRTRGCTECGRTWRRERYDMTIVWVREKKR
jgi:hypothetical protein